MKRHILITLVFILTGAINAQTVPQQFAPGIISNGKAFSITLTPDGKQAYYTMLGVNNKLTIVTSTLSDSGWTKPKLAEFAKRYENAYPFITLDGGKLFFMSRRPPPGFGGVKTDYDLWMVEKTDSGWSEPWHISWHGINTQAAEGYPTAAANGNLYFMSDREGGIGKVDIYVSRFIDGRYTKPQNLDVFVNSEESDLMPYISPDEHYLIFYSEREDGVGETDFYVSYNRGGFWTDAELIDNTNINTGLTEYCPYVSPDGKYFFFSRIERNGYRSIYRVDFNSTGIVW